MDDYDWTDVSNGALLELLDGVNNAHPQVRRLVESIHAELRERGATWTPRLRLILSPQQ